MKFFKTTGNPKKEIILRALNTGTSTAMSLVMVCLLFYVNIAKFNALSSISQILLISAIIGFLVWTVYCIDQTYKDYNSKE